MFNYKSFRHKVGLPQKGHIISHAFIAAGHVRSSSLLPQDILHLVHLLSRL